VSPDRQETFARAKTPEAAEELLAKIRALIEDKSLQGSESQSGVGNKNTTIWLLTKENAEQQRNATQLRQLMELTGLLLGGALGLSGNLRYLAFDTANAGPDRCLRDGANIPKYSALSWDDGARKCVGWFKPQHRRKFCGNVPPHTRPKKNERLLPVTRHC
jgi:hypothetical protein